jgi:hypothetical protein
MKVPMRRRFTQLWNRLPVIVRGIFVAELVVSIGTIPPSIAMIPNLRTSPSIPWILVVTAGWLWFFWWYLSVHGQSGYEHNNKGNDEKQSVLQSAKL